jgi:hypothetical protein
MQMLLMWGDCSCFLLDHCLLERKQSDLPGMSCPLHSLLLCRR